MNHLIFVRHQLYKLKREYGFPLAVYKTTVGDTNLETGVKSITKTKHRVKRAIVMPVKFETSVFYSAAFMKAARAFAMGGYQDQEIKRIIIDGRDLPRSYVMAPEDYVIYKHNRYEIMYFEQLEEVSGYQLIAKRLVGAQVDEIHEVTVYQTMRFLHSSVEEP